MRWTAITYLILLKHSSRNIDYIEALQVQPKRDSVINVWGILIGRRFHVASIVWESLYLLNIVIYDLKFWFQLEHFIRSNFKIRKKIFRGIRIEQKFLHWTWTQNHDYAWKTPISFRKISSELIIYPTKISILVSIDEISL